MLSCRDNGCWNVSSLMWLWRGIRIVMRRRWKMNPEAFMLSDRLEKLMLASVAASLRSHSRPCRLHVARLKKYFIEVWGWSGRRPSSHRGHIFCPIRHSSLDGRPLQPCDPARSQNVHLLCAPSRVPGGLHSRCGFFCTAPVERPAADHC